MKRIVCLAFPFPLLEVYLEIEKSFEKSNGEILEIKTSSEKIKRRNFGNQKVIREIKQRNFGNQKTIREIERTRQESKHIIILVILIEHRMFVLITLNVSHLLNTWEST